VIAAIYARKSTDQNGVADEAKSVTRQIEHAQAYAARKGWTVRDEHVYVDDGISGAEFANRPGFDRLMAALKPRAPVQVLIMSEESRLGREAIETAYALKQLITASVRMFFYLEDRERTFDSPTDKLLMSVTAFADEVEREKARQLTYDAMQRKAKAGHVTGGRVFGYDNVEVLGQTGSARTSSAGSTRTRRPSSVPVIVRGGDPAGARRARAGAADGRPASTRTRARDRAGRMRPSGRCDRARRGRSTCSLNACRSVRRPGWCSKGNSIGPPIDRVLREPGGARAPAAREARRLARAADAEPIERAGGTPAAARRADPIYATRRGPASRVSV
jgi:DNA invertase Pin-like site-specific DNA recombinase